MDLDSDRQRMVATNPSNLGIIKIVMDFEKCSKMNQIWMRSTDFASVYETEIYFQKSALDLAIIMIENRKIGYSGIINSNKMHITCFSRYLKNSSWVKLFKQFIFKLSI